MSNTDPPKNPGSRVFCWVCVAHLVCPLSLIPGFLLGQCCSSPFPSLSYPGFFAGSVLLISFALSLLSRVFCWVGVAHLVYPLSLIPGFWWVSVAHLVYPLSLIPGVLVGQCYSSRLPSLSYPGFFVGSVLLISFTLYLLSRVFCWVGVAHLVCLLSLIPGFLLGQCCSSRLPSLSYPGCFAGSVILYECCFKFLLVIRDRGQTRRETPTQQKTRDKR
jgi:hypothetical protein